MTFFNIQISNKHQFFLRYSLFLAISLSTIVRWCDNFILHLNWSFSFLTLTFFVVVFLGLEISKEFFKFTFEILVSKSVQNFIRNFTSIFPVRSKSLFFSLWVVFFLVENNFSTNLFGFWFKLVVLFFSLVRVPFFIILAFSYLVNSSVFKEFLNSRYFISVTSNRSVQYPTAPEMAEVIKHGKPVVVGVMGLGSGAVAAENKGVQTKAEAQGQVDEIRQDAKDICTDKVHRCRELIEQKESVNLDSSKTQVQKAMETAKIDEKLEHEAMVFRVAKDVVDHAHQVQNVIKDENSIQLGVRVYTAAVGLKDSSLPWDDKVNGLLKHYQDVQQIEEDYAFPPQKSEKSSLGENTEIVPSVLEFLSF